MKLLAKTLGDHLRSRVRGQQALFQAVVSNLNSKPPLVDLAMHSAARGMVEAHALDKEIREVLALSGPAPIRPVVKPYASSRGKATPCA